MRYTGFQTDDIEGRGIAVVFSKCYQKYSALTRGHKAYVLDRCRKSVRNIAKLRMRKIFISVLFIFAFLDASYAQYITDSTLLLSKDDMQWWRDAKFGLFIHFGLYSILGRGEWVMFNERIDKDEYARLKDRFTCESLDAKQWVEIAKEAGCKYMVVTARHHDGFCLFDTRFGDFDAVNSSAKRDLIAEYVEAAHQAGMKTGIYYSPLDWRYPGFFFPDMYRASAEEMKKQTYAQVRELLTQYGKIDILWYDGGEDNWLGLGGLMWDGAKGWHTRGFQNLYTGKFSWEPIKLNTMVRELQPKIVISQRSGWMGDFETLEVGFKGRADDNRPWELCTLLGGTAWGWTPSSATHIMSLDSCVQLLVMVVCQNGNLLLNVGPKPDGAIEPAEVQRLKEIGKFLSKYGESIYHTRGGIYDARWGGTTITDKAIYVHVLKVPPGNTINLPFVSQKILSARYLRDNRKATFVQRDTGVSLINLADKRNEPDLVIELALE
jgi:alpha-L-fucosidase